MSQPSLDNWIGRQETVKSMASSVVARMLSAALSSDAVADFAQGDALPALWHWAMFHPIVAHTSLGRDGHPQTGGFLPPVPLERRMWAGGRVEFLKEIEIGASMIRRSTIARIRERHATSGRMVFVCVEHSIDTASGTAIREEQDIVYLPMPETYRPPERIAAPHTPIFEETERMDAIRLFRYSAATFNAHRIHYDLAYAQQVEHYPGLVVHGPMQATFLIAAAIRHRGTTPGTFTYRGVHPMFHDHALRIIGVEDDDDGLQLCTAAPAACGGHQGMQARATWS